MILGIYLIIAIVCALLLIVMAALGGFGGGHDVSTGHDVGIGHHDIHIGHGHDGDMGHYNAGHGDYSGSSLSPLSIPILLVFGTSFGAIGALLDGSVDWWIVPVVAALVAVAIAGSVYFLVLNTLVKTQGSTHITLQDFVGLDGLVIIGIKAGAPGQVAVNTVKRGRVPVPAVAKEDIDTNSSVKVIGIAGDAVMVEKKKEG